MGLKLCHQGYHTRNQREVWYMESGPNRVNAPLGGPGPVTPRSRRNLFKDQSFGTTVVLRQTPRPAQRQVRTWTPYKSNQMTCTNSQRTPIQYCIGTEFALRPSAAGSLRTQGPGPRGCERTVHTLGVRIRSTRPVPGECALHKRSQQPILFSSCALKASCGPA